MHFLSRRFNQRTDEYGGSLENRARLLRELLEDTHEAVGDTCAVALRLAVDELIGSAGLTSDGEGRELVEMLAEIPDLWDVNIAEWKNDSQTSRFSAEGFQEPFTKFVKSLTTKPVVGVGRFTSPDAMVSQIRRGVLDLIGAARPSIADPFLPAKINAGRLEDIRECIGCNICVACDNLNAPIRCTQNPTMGEEWRRGWHPEKIAPKASDKRILVVGAGPAGLEAAHQLAKRGYEVALADRATELGGRVAKEARLPGLAAWQRVADYRIQYLKTAPNVSLYLDSDLAADDIRDFGFDHVILATGATWRKDGVGRSNRFPIPGLEQIPVYSPDDLMAGASPTGHVLVYDDEHYYMAGVLCEKLVALGSTVTYVTTESVASAFTFQTLEQERIQKRLIELGVTIRPLMQLVGPKTISCVYSGREEVLDVDSLVLVTEREPDDALTRALEGEVNVTSIGDCVAPGIIAQAVLEGHRAARLFDDADADPAAHRREFFEFDLPGARP